MVENKIRKILRLGCRTLSVGWVCGSARTVPGLYWKAVKGIRFSFAKISL